MTLGRLGREYREAHPAGYAASTTANGDGRRSRQCDRSIATARSWLWTSGKRAHLVDPATGEVAVELFVGVLGASGLVYAEATRRQALAAGVGGHVRMLEYFPDSPAVCVSDNLKSGVTPAHAYEPTINRTYASPRRITARW